MQFSLRAKFFSIIALILFGIVVRLLPHTPNVTPVSAIALLVSVYFGFRSSFASMVIIMLISDFFIGFYTLPIMFSVYGSFVFVSLLGRFPESPSIEAIVVRTLASSLIFFIITNFAVWQFGTMYPHSPQGLLESYFMAIPFFKSSLIGDLLYTGLLFGVFYILTHKEILLNKVYNYYYALKRAN